MDDHFNEVNIDRNNNMIENENNGHE